MPSEDKNGEIWSTRIQQELLALTTDNADLQATEARSMIPPFTTIKNHKLDIARGTCIVEVEIDIQQKLKSEGNKTTNDKVIIALDASLHKKSDGSIDKSKPSYPFNAPVVLLKSGEHMFPPGSTIINGEKIAMDLDWTPSLHLTDAIMNLGLKVKESIIQGEPFHPAPPEPESKRFSFGFGKGSISKAFSHKSKSSAAATAPSAAQRKPRTAVPAKTTLPQTPGDVKIGDEINLLEEPWVSAHGVYSCKAIRRPAFIEETMKSAAKKLEAQPQEPSFAAAGAMFRSFAQSARSVMEESFLMVTESHIIELKASRLNVSSGTVAFCIPIDMMAKLKFRRQESLSLFFKTAPNDPLVYMCPDSGDAVHQIQSVLKRHGVRGKHTNAAAYKAISEAMHLVQAIQTKELALKHDPTVERVNEIMDLYRQAAERFEVAGDIRHEEVVTHMRKFLALPQTVAILDGSFKKPDDSPKRVSVVNGVPEGEVLERTDAQLYDDDEMDLKKGKSKEEVDKDKAFEENIDNLLKDAKADFGKLGLDGDGTLETDAPSASTVGEVAGDELADIAADLDAMMREADKELAELMNS